MSVSKHVHSVTSSCVQHLYALKVLRAHGLCDEALQQVFIAVIIFKISYASTAWWGFTSAADRHHLEAFLRRSIRSRLCSPEHADLTQLVDAADDKLFQRILTRPNDNHILLANVNVLRYVCYMRTQFRLSSVCLSSVTLVHPTQAVELFGNFFSPYDSPGTLLFWCQKSMVGDAPFPLKFAFKVTHPLSNSEISTNIGS